MGTGETTPTKPKWELYRAEDRKRWWIRDDVYTPQPRTPLSASTFNVLWEEVAMWTSAEVCVPDSIGWSVRTVNGYTYLSPLPISDPKIVEDRLVKFQTKIGEMVANVDRDFARYHDEQARDMEYWRSINLPDLSLLALLEQWRRLMLTFDRFLKIHFLIVVPRHIVAGGLEQTARTVAGLQSSADIGKLTQSMGMTKQIEFDMELWRLAGRAIALRLEGTMLGTMEEELMEALESSESGSAWLGELNGFLDTYGARTALPMELHEPTWKEDPTPVLATIRSYVAQGGHYNFDRLTKDMADERTERVKSALANISDEEARERFRGTIEAARKLQAAMEDDNFYLSWMWAQVRRVALEVGRRLAAGGVLDDPDDVFFLTKEEAENTLKDFAAGIYDLSHIVPLAGRRRAEWREQLVMQAPPYLGEPPEEIHDFLLNEFWGIRGRRQLEEAESDILTGLGASGGVADGTARLVLGPDQFGRIQFGEVLVCRSTNPAWTPVFSKISAVVTDQGGTLCHAAIVAREYGIPAVLGTIHGTRRIPHGARVRVDGDLGKVEVL